MSKKSIGLIVCVCLLMGLAAPSSAMAGSKDKRIKIASILKAMNIMDTIDAMMPQMSQAVIRAFHQQGLSLPPEVVKEISVATSRVMRANLRPYLTRVVDIYDEAFTDSEIDDLVTFYKSPTGQKSLKFMPQMTQKSMEVGMKWGQALQPKLQLEIEQIFAKYKIE